MHHHPQLTFVQKTSNKIHIQNYIGRQRDEKKSTLLTFFCLRKGLKHSRCARFKLTIYLISVSLRDGGKIFDHYIKSKARRKSVI